MIYVRLLAVLSLVGGLSATAAPQAANPEETIYVDELKKSFLTKIDRCVEAEDWKSLFSHYDFARTRYAQKVVPLADGTANRRWSSVSEYLLRRLSSSLPKEAFEYYRFEKDGEAQRAFDRARAENDERALRKAVDTYFFATGADVAMDELGNRAFDAGRPEEAVFYWNRLLKYYPDSKISKVVLAARIAHACGVAENEAALKSVRDTVARGKLEGEARIGGRTSTLKEYLDGVSIPERKAQPRPVKMPYAVQFEDRYRRGVLGVRNEIKRWTYDFTKDTGKVAKAAASTPQAQAQALQRARIMRATRTQGTPTLEEYPLFPAYAKVGDRDYVIATDGTRVLAVDPVRVAGESAVKGVYWKYPEEGRILPPNQSSNARQFGGATRPYIGVAVDGRRAYVTMYSAKRTAPAPNPRNYDFFRGVTAVKCLDIPTGRVVWDTDDESLLPRMKEVCKEFYDRNFSFCGPPLVRDGRLYLGVSTSPSGERESRVVCLDQETGRPLWSSFLCSVPGARNAWRGWNGATGVAYQTLLAEQGGVLYAHTNLGVVGALSGMTGDILWLTKYRRSSATQASRFRSGGNAWIRAASWPAIWKGTVFVLPQDREDLLAFEKVTGSPADPPEVKKRFGEFSWRNISHLVGIVNDWMVLGGNQSHVLRLKDFQAYSLAASNTTRCGHGVIHGDLVYLPARPPSPENRYGVLAVYDASPSPGSRGQPTWKNLDQVAWKGDQEYGNVLIAGDSLVVATDKIMVYTDVETIRAGFVRRLYQSPPNVAAMLAFGDTMMENGRLEEAAEAYLAFVAAAAGDASMEPRVAEVRTQLYSIFLKRGETAARRGDLEKALEFYDFSKKFAYDAKTTAEATQRMAETFERLKRWKEAVGQYQELIEKARGLYHREADQVVRLWEHAQKSIEGIVEKAPDAYDDVEREAAKAYEEAKKQGSEALQAVMDRFPNSKTAKDAWQSLAEMLLKEGRFDKLRSLYESFKDRFKMNLDLDGSRRVIDALEQLGDVPRLRYELAALERRFPDGSVVVGERTLTVPEFVAEKSAGLPDLAAAPALNGPLKLIGELDAPGAIGDPHALRGAVLPLRPRGVAPPGFGPHLALFQRGSAIELRDLREKKLLWTRAHPGGYLGVVFQSAPVGVSVAGVKEGSPAAAAGLKQGDVILSLDGELVSAKTFTGALAARAAGRPVVVAGHRGGAEIKETVKLAARPAGLRPGIVGATFTQDYALAVAWEDQIASLDLGTGAVRWTFRDVRDRFVLGGFHSTDGRLFAYEVPRPQRDRDVFRSFTAEEQRSRMQFGPAEAHFRLLCLGDSDGEVVWAKAFDAPLSGAGVTSEITFFGDYLSDEVIFLQTLPRTGAKDWILWQLSARDGTLIDGGVGRRVLLGTVLAHAMDLPSGMFYYVCDPSNRRQERYLKSLALTEEARKRKRVDVSLHSDKYMPRKFTRCMLAADGKYLCLVVLPAQANAGYRIWVFHADGGAEFRSLSLLPDRTLPMNGAEGTILDRNGLLYLYNIPRSEAASGAPRRAFLTAFRIAADIGDIWAWDAVAPVLSNNASLPWRIASGNGAYAVFSADRATPPGGTGEEALAVVYDKQAEGYIHMVHPGLATFSGASGARGPAVTSWRGRLYVSAAQGLRIYGE